MLDASITAGLIDDTIDNAVGTLTTAVTSVAIMAVRRRGFLTSAVMAATGLTGCVSRLGRGFSESGTLTIAAGTTTHDTGILGEFNRTFEARFPATVKAIPRGTGAVLRLIEDGEIDLGFTHAPSSERQLIQDGWAINRRTVMWNWFTVVGPQDDPANIRTADRLTDAFTRLAEIEAGFLSRGDNSGTHQREVAIWNAIGVEPAGSWYKASGQGMGNTLVQADQSIQYTLTDIGTFRSMRSRHDLHALVNTNVDDPFQLNQYSLLATNPDQHTGIEHALAMAYIGFVTGEEGQSIIRDFEIDGQQLFHQASTIPDGTVND